MKKNKLRFLIVGLGSMGKRRIRNLMSNGEHQIIGYDILPRRLKESKIKYQIRTVNDLKEIVL